MRFPKSATVRDSLHRLFVTTLLALAAFALLGKAAHAQQSCGPLGAQPEAVFIDLTNLLADRFPIAEASTCEKIVKAGIAACHKAVSSTASCTTSVISNSYKALRAACVMAADPRACSSGAKEEADTNADIIDGYAGVAHAVCDEEFADELFEDCMGIAPPM
jgi:hypothetical protein